MCFEHFEKLQNQKIFMIALWKSNDFELWPNLLGKFLPQKPTFYDIKKTKIFSKECLCQTFYSHYLPWYLVSVLNEFALCGLFWLSLNLF